MPRPRDFFDIYTVQKHYEIDFTDIKNHNLITKIFAAKRVPLDLIGCISDYREFHRQGFDSLKDTLKPNVTLKDFDYYFDFLIDRTEKLESLWVK